MMRVHEQMITKTVELKHVDLHLGQAAARVHVLRDISFSVNPGEAVGLIGPSGSGKSTLLMTIAGLERPDTGEIIIDGVSLAAFNEDQLARFRGQRIGIIFQSFHLIPSMTALENVALPLELAGEQDAFGRAARQLERVGLRARLHHYPVQLSGGEQQRVAIARAIAPEPSILIADEPTGNLDDVNGKAVIDLLFSLKQERNVTLILVTHDNSLAAMCDRIVRLRSGRIEADSREDGTQPVLSNMNTPLVQPETANDETIS